MSAIARAAQWLAGPARARAIEAIERDSGVSRAMAEWGLDASCSVIDTASIEAFRAREGETLAGMNVALGLARSVATAPLRSIAVAFSRGASKVWARAPRAQRAVTALVVEAFAREGFAIEDSDADDGESWLRERIEQGAGAAIVFGGDPWIERARAIVGGRARFEGHGHGLGASWVAGAVSDAEIEQIAWDFCAYDGDGCLSPQVVWVEGDADALGERLAEAMASWGERVARGLVSRERAVMERGWRAGAAAAARGFRAGRGWSVAVFGEGTGEGVRAIGGRNVVVRASEDGASARGWMEQNARWVTALGVSEGARERVSAWAAERGRASGFRGRVCDVGRAQRPGFDGEADPRAQ